MNKPEINESENQDQEAPITIKNSMGKNGLILAIFALLTTALISITYFGTKKQIDAQEQATLLARLNAVIDANDYDNEVQLNCAIVSSATYLGDGLPKHIYRASLDGKPTSVAIETTAPDGYSGKIELLVGVKTTDVQGEAIVTGVRIIKHKETPGLGDKIELRVSDWILSFNQKSYSKTLQPNWAVKKDGGQFDQFTGATISPRAVVNAVQKSVEYYVANQAEISNVVNDCALTSSNIQKGSKNE
ncbi:electron transport complex subunit RsxG [Paraglaciecola sp. 2405UD69-4]|uniref:electron transport complex subunit RsxG n=1 Tax=Paraglaciecola sp. 2405UD69-4 TaxID=3391836 RepID=UPI0039C8D08F